MFPRYLQYLLTDFRQTFVTGASRDRDELIRFWVQRSKVKVTAWPNTSQIFMFPRYLQYLLIDFRQTFVTGASWDSDDLITFLGQKVKVQGHAIAAEAHSTRRYRRVQLFLIKTLYPSGKTEKFVQNAVWPWIIHIHSLTHSFTHSFICSKQYINSIQM